MANTQSAKKAIRSSARKAEHNMFWKNRIKKTMIELRKSLASKTAEESSLQTQLKKLQKILDKSAKEKVIHKNKANRLKSRYANKISARFSKSAKKPSTGAKRSSSK